MSDDLEGLAQILWENRPHAVPGTPVRIGDADPRDAHVWREIASKVMDAGFAQIDHADQMGTCPTCSRTRIEQHPRHDGIERCGNCKDWLTVRIGSEHHLDLIRLSKAEAWDEAANSVMEWQASYMHGDNGPPDPPTNPYDR